MKSAQNKLSAYLILFTWLITSLFGTEIEADKIQGNPFYLAPASMFQIKIDTGESKWVGTLASSVTFNGKFAEWTEAERKRLGVEINGLKDKMPAIRENLKKYGLKPELAGQILRYLDINDKNNILHIKKAQDGIQGAEAFYERKEDTTGKQQLRVVLDESYDESSIFHEIIESILKQEVGDKAHAYTFILESEVYPGSVERKLRQYAQEDPNHIGNILVDTKRELGDIDRLTELEETARIKKKENALNIEKLGKEIVDEMGLYTAEDTISRLNKAQDEYQVGARALIRNFEMKDLKTRIMINQLLDSLKTYDRIDKDQYTGAAKYFLKLGDEKAPRFVNSVGMTEKEIIDAMKGENFWSIQWSGLQSFRTSGEMINGNPHLWRMKGKIYFVLTDEDFHLNKVEDLANEITSEESTKEDTKDSDAVKQLKKKLFPALMRRLVESANKTEKLFYLGSRTGFANGQEVRDYDEAIKMSRIFLGVKNFNELLPAIEKYSFIRDFKGAQKNTFEKQLKDHVSTIWRELVNAELKQTGASKTFGRTSTVALDKNLKMEDIAGANTVVLQKGNNRGKGRDQDIGVDENWLEANLGLSEAGTNRTLINRRRNYAKQSVKNLRAINQAIESYINTQLSDWTLEGMSRQQLKAAMLKAIVDGILKGNNLDLSQPLTYKFSLQSTSNLRGENVPRLTVSIGQGTNLETFRDQAWKAGFLQTLQAKLSPEGSAITTKDSSTDVDLVIDFNRSAEEAGVAKEGQITDVQEFSLNLDSLLKPRRVGSSLVGAAA